MDTSVEKRFRELAERSAVREIPCYTDFLDLSEQSVLSRIRPSLPEPDVWATSVRRPTESSSALRN